MHVERTGEINHRTHHRDRTHRVDDVDAAGSENIAGHVGHKTLASIAAVVGTDQHFPEPAKFILEDDPFP